MGLTFFCTLKSIELLRQRELTAMPLSSSKIIVSLLLLTFLCLSLSGIVSKSATFDEVQYVGIGKYIVKNHKWDVMGSILHPPLSYYLNSVPLLFVDDDVRLWQYEEKERGIDFLGGVDIIRGQELLSAPFNAGDRLLISSRLLFALMGMWLGYYVYRFSRLLYGETGGFLSLFLFTFCPNMLAYSGLILPDMPLALFTLAFCCHFWICLDSDTMGNRLMTGLFLGLALLSKFTALLLIPLLVIPGTLFRRKELSFSSSRTATISGCAFAVLCLGYGFNLTPYVQGIVFQFQHASGGHSSFLLGEHSLTGWWYYYLVVFMLKTPLPLLLLVTAVLAAYHQQSEQMREKMQFLLMPVIILAGFFSIMHQSIGLRYILPVYPLIFVLSGSLTAYSGRFRQGLYLLCFWYALGTLWSAPHFLCYFNELIGSNDNGYKYLVDSNLDWGQDLKGLKRYMEQKGIKRITLSYFGADTPKRYGIDYDWLPSHYLLNPGKDDALRIPENQLLAISATNLQGVYFDDKNLYKWLLDYQPVTVIGHSIFVYDVADP